MLTHGQISDFPNFVAEDTDLEEIAVRTEGLASFPSRD
jgi:hypothetical protein